MSDNREYCKHTKEEIKVESTEYYKYECCEHIKEEVKVEYKQESTEYYKYEEITKVEDIKQEIKAEVVEGYEKVNTLDENIDAALRTRSLDLAGT